MFLVLCQTFKNSLSHIGCRNLNGYLNSGLGGTVYIGITDEGVIKGLQLTQYTVSFSVSFLGGSLSPLCKSHGTPAVLRFWLVLSLHRAHGLGLVQGPWSFLSILNGLGFLLWAIKHRIQETECRVGCPSLLFSSSQSAAWFYLQKDHLVTAVDDLMTRYIPPVESHRYKVEFVPVVDKESKEEERMQIVHYDSQWDACCCTQLSLEYSYFGGFTVVSIPHRQRADPERRKQNHLLRQQHYCWCHKDAVAQLNMVLYSQPPIILGLYAASHCPHLPLGVSKISCLTAVPQK